jgi:hypothetical protein
MDPPILLVAWRLRRRHGELGDELTDMLFERGPNVVTTKVTELGFQAPFELAPRVTTATCLEVMLHAHVLGAMELAV